MKEGYDYFHSDDPVEAAKFVVSEAEIVAERARAAKYARVT